MSSDQIVLEVIKTGLSAVLLVLTWVGGQRILVGWERRKKQNEIDLAALAQLHRVHAEFRTIGRLWRSFAVSATTVRPVDAHWQLQVRAATAEGEMEALVVKIATERILTADQIEALGFLREAYQLLRRRIRDGQYFYWQRGTPEHAKFYASAIAVASVLSKSGKDPSVQQSADALDRIRAASLALLAQDAFKPIDRVIVPAASPGPPSGSATG